MSLKYGFIFFRLNIQFCTLVKMEVHISPFHGINPNLPLTITPIMKSSNEQRFSGPDLTFHCMCCGDVFDNPQMLYQHMSKCHSNLNGHQQLKNEEMDEDDEDSFEYSSIMEPICELVHSDDDDDEDDRLRLYEFPTNSKMKQQPLNNKSERGEQSSPSPQMMEHDDENSSGSSTGIFPQHMPREALHGLYARQLPEQLGRQDERRNRREKVDSRQLINNCFQCSQCEKSFQNAGDLAKHVRSHTLNKPYQCSICDKTFTHIGSLNTHIRIHSGEKPYKCDICSKAFTQSSSLMVHLRSHAVKKPHQCHLCDKGKYMSIVELFKYSW